MQQFMNQNETSIQAFTKATDNEDLTEKLNLLQRDMESVNFKEVSRIKIGRNEACPCGSGKKFKKCHLGNFHIEEEDE